MSNQYFNFYYDPIRQGYDTSTWKTIFGDAPVAGANKLLIAPQSSFIHYGDILRGDASINLNLPAPASGDDKKFGFAQLGKDAYIYFQIVNGAFTAETSNGTTTNSVTIEWQTAWSDADISYRIKWEAGRAIFYVNEIEQAVIADASVSGDPLSIYVNNNSEVTMLFNHVNVKGIQSYMFSSGNEDSAFAPVVYEADRVSISESVTIYITRFDVSVFDSLSMTEDITVAIV